MAGKIRKAMKKFISMFAMAQMIIWSCAKPEIDSPAPVAPDTDGVVFTALADAAMTKADPAAGGVVSWTENDEIGVYDGTAYVKAEIISIEGNKVIFSADVDENAGKYIAVSPYEFALTDNGEFTMDGENVKLNTAATAQTAGKQVVSIASTSASTEPFAFKNVCNLLRFKVEKTTVKQAKITGAAGTEKIAGVLSVDPSTGAATGALTETAIVTEITPGVDNFIALAPGTSLPDGFTITLYGDQISDAGYEGEVASVGALDFTGENARNKMRNLGTIDGWIDNYALWQKGKPITIAGVEFNKATYGDGHLLTADNAEVDLFDLLYNKTGNLVFFLDAVGTGTFFQRTFVNIGTSSAKAKVMLVSRYDNQRVKYSPVQQFNLTNGQIAVKGVEFDFSKSTSATKALFRTNTTVAMDHIYFENCKFNMLPNYFCFKMEATNIHAVKDLKFVDSDFVLTSDFAGNHYICYSAANPFLNEMEIFEFRNNVVYNTTAIDAVQVFASGGAQPTSGQQRTIVTINNNTFYNVSLPTIFQSNSLSSLEFKNNILYLKEKLEGKQQIVAYSKDETNKYPYYFENNIAVNMTANYFNPNQGLYSDIMMFVPSTTDNIFAVAEPQTGQFVTTAKYASYGAQR